MESMQLSGITLRRLVGASDGPRAGRRYSMTGRVRRHWIGLVVDDTGMRLTHSRRTLLSRRSQVAFMRGARIAIFRMRMQSRRDAVEVRAELASCSLRSLPELARRSEMIASP